MPISRNGEHFNLRNMQIDSLFLTCSYPGPNTMRSVQQVSSNACHNVSLSCNYPDQNIFNLENVIVNNFVVGCNHPDRNIFNLRNTTFINRVSENNDRCDRQGEEGSSVSEDDSSKEDSSKESDFSLEEDATDVNDPNK